MEDTKVEEGFKICSRCGQVKPLSLFYKKKSTKDGLRSECKACSIARVSEYNAIHKEEQKAYNAEYYQDNKEAILKYKAEYYQANKDKQKAYNAEYYQDNKEAIAQKAADYYQSNKDAILKKHAEYRDPILNPLNWARKIVGNYRDMDRERGFDTSKTVTAEWFLENIAYQPCAHCGLQGIGKVCCNRLDNTKGHTIDNVEPCCKSCNARENIRDQIERGVHISQLRKKQSFKDFVNEHKAKDKNLT